MEHHLNDLVGIAEKNGLLSALPLLDVDELGIVAVLPLWGVLLREVELEGLKLLVAIEVALKVLQENNFLVNRFRVVEEIEVRDLVSHALRRLSVAIELRLLLGALDVVKVEQVGVQDDLCAIVEVFEVVVVEAGVVQCRLYMVRFSMPG